MDSNSIDEIQIAHLPRWWSPRHGLHFPMNIKLNSGEEIWFDTYEEYHNFIRITFKKK